VGATPLRKPAPEAPLEYQTGFGNEHASEALPGALPIGRSSPQRCPYHLYAEKLTGTAFTVPRAHNLRTWLYRIRPSVQPGVFHPRDAGLLRSAPIAEAEPTPNPLRWSPFAIPTTPLDFVDGLVTLGAGGDARLQRGIGVHVYRANCSMEDRFFYDADGELLIVPQQGELRIHTECGHLALRPGYVALIPRGLKFRVELPDGAVRGYLCENYGSPLSLPERGPVGSDGFANDRDFEAPVAAFEDREGSFELLCKFGGKLFACEIDHSPLDVVAWYGRCVPYRYDLSRYNAMGTVSYDHPDPSIYTVLSSPSETEGVANVDFVIFPPRWLVAEDTFRPPYYHRNVMSEFMGLVEGEYDAKRGGFLPGGASLHNALAAHGPDAAVFAQATEATLEPRKLANTLAFMFESRYAIQPTRFALDAEELQLDYSECWRALPKRFTGGP